MDVLWIDKQERVAHIYTFNRDGEVWLGISSNCNPFSSPFHRTPMVNMSAVVLPEMFDYRVPWRGWFNPQNAKGTWFRDFAMNIGATRVGGVLVLA